MFRKVLIANRGEIACRVAATLHEMNIGSVAVYSEADRGARHVAVADEAIEIGPSDPRQSYLDAERIVDAARRSGAEAIHPGYGFLAESAAFAGAVEGCGLTFIGPTPDQVRAMGDKRVARGLAHEAGVPVVPGVETSDPADLRAAAKSLGFPVIVKAALGGGGKGMRIVANDTELAEAIESARRVAGAAFGDSAIYLEKVIAGPRHVEVQVLGDGRGKAVHLLERECTLQRRHQKIVEECPSPSVDDTLRARLVKAALALARRVEYRGAGTVEFLLGADGNFHFLEMNTRLQVEHPVTERVTGLDLVRLQLEIAASGALPIAQKSIEGHGHAVEARVYAEDPANDFLPQAGTAARVEWPGGPFVRVDHGVRSGDTVPVHYDPILAKLVAHGPDRDQALDRLTGAVDATLIHGVVTNLPFLRALLRDDTVRAGRFDTEWIEREFMARFHVLAQAPAPDLAFAAAAIAEALGVGRTSLVRHGAARGASHATPDAFTALGRWRLPGMDA